MEANNTDTPSSASSSSRNSAQLPSALQSHKGDDYAKNNLLQIPSINMPKGGGALKSIDEKFQVNSANGTSSFSIPVPMSKSRSGFAPLLSLNYNSGSGNSPFGLGWNISLPSIKRRTDKLLPTYRDATDSDIFQIAGAEDMVLKLIEDAKGQWQPDNLTVGNYSIKRYVPRIEGSFTLIEQVTSTTGMYWKTTSKDNTVIFYGLTQAARITDPANPLHIFEWLPEISYDDKGNSFQYTYAQENLANVPSLLHEGNRLNGNQGIANTYLKKVFYGNTTPYNPTLAGGIADPYMPVIPDESGYLFSLVLDYGDHAIDTPTPAPSTTWACRLDPFSNYKAGFEIRTYRLCRRFLMFHNFTELDTNPVLVKSLDLNYQHYNFQQVTDPYTLNFVEADFILSITASGWRGTAGSGYQKSSYPPVNFTYQMPVWNSIVETVSAENRINIPEGLTSAYQFTDLYNEGISGILSEQSEGWYYNSNLGDGVFTPASMVAPKPSFTGLRNGSLQLQSLTGDGRKFIVSTNAPNQGYFELTDQQEWLPFMAFEQYPAIDIKDPNIKFIDLNGDGMPDIVLSEEQVFTWYPAAGTVGYDSPELTPKSFDEEKGPAIVFADPVQSIFLADMTGDGLTDIVRIRNGEISYWPNLGYGIFGAKVNMLNAPLFDTIDAFNPEYIHLSDINGTGANDILYLGKNKLRAWLNMSGNAWGPPFEAPAFPDIASPNQLSVADFLGNGTACIIWSSPLANNADNPLKYIDLMGGYKPYLMNGYTNGMGKQVTINYKSSTYFYLQDKQAGTPWITKLCFPVQCVESIIVDDSVSQTQYSSSYTYHHGYYDHSEKEYRGFGRVEQTDTDIFNTDAIADQAPIHTKTWFHTGVYFGMNNILHQLAKEYFQNTSFVEYTLPEPLLPANLTADEAREAVRACKGMILRREVYALDGNINPGLVNYPYSVAEHNNNITMLQPQGSNMYAVFLSTESENITYNYERNPADPRITHALNTAFDEYGNVIDSYGVVYPRQSVNPAKPGGISLPGNQPLPSAVILEQQKTYIVYSHNAYTGKIINTLTYRLPVACENISYQLTGISPAENYFSISDFTNPSATPTLSKLKHQRTLFLKDDLVTPLPLYTMDMLGLAYQQYHLAFNATVTALSTKASTSNMQDAKYLESDTYKGTLFPSTDNTGEWWIMSGTIIYDALHFYLPTQFLDAYGYATSVVYDNYSLLMKSVIDAVNNTTSAVYDYRVLAPSSVTDPNDNVTYYNYDILCLLVAVAMYGKGEGDMFAAGFTSELTPAQISAFFSNPYTSGLADSLLQGATTRYIYDFVSGGPFSSGVIARQIHANQQPDPRVDIASIPYQYLFEYTDGLGRTAMKKIPADVTTGAPGSGSCTGTLSPQHQWIGNGKMIYNNKGKPVMQYEPYFSTTPAYEKAPINGVSSIIHYDPTGRVIRTDFPDSSYSKTEFDAWVQIIYDQDDTVNTVDNAWYQQYANSTDSLDNDAATKALVNKDTPSAAHLDPLGRNFYSVAFNIVNGSNEFYASQTILDLESNPLAVIDAMGNSVMQYEYDLLNRPIHSISMEAGERWILHDIMNKPFAQWDINGTNTFSYTYSYDFLHRLLQSNVKINGISYLTAYNIYGENISINGASDVANNLRGKLYRQFDQSGLVTHYLYDFKGNLVQSSRIFATAFNNTNTLLPAILWTGDPSDLNLLIKNEEYVSLVSYDATNRPILHTRPFIPASLGSIIPLPYTQIAINNADVFVPGYGESGALNTVNIYNGGGTKATPYVTRICHNEKGQRLCIQYGNNTVTRHSYDPDTFRLTRLLTTVNSGTIILQDMNYYYDPVGNITYLVDKAQPPIHYNNQTVVSDGNYTYDAIYRLVSATGREQIGQNTVNENPSNANYRNYPFDTPSSYDSGAMRNYTQNYQYDAVGNMKKLQHVANGGSYTRIFAYNNNATDRTNFGVASSSIMNNQLLATTVGSSAAIKYSFDTHGNMLNLPELPGMAWNYQDEFVSATQQSVSNGGTGLTTYYNYDGAGTRSRKVTMSAASAGGTSTIVSERLYIGNFEIYRTYDALGHITLQRETLHVMDDKSRIATIDNKTIDITGTDPSILNMYYPRYQYANHLGSSAYELDDTGNIVSYEEYHPFGTTSYMAMENSIEVPMKRYRFTGQERDEESGLYYQGARYYAPWLCRWTAADPIGIGDGLNMYIYTSDNPIMLKDPSGTDGEACGVDDEEAQVCRMTECPPAADNQPAGPPAPPPPAPPAAPAAAPAAQPSSPGIGRRLLTVGVGVLQTGGGALEIAGGLGGGALTCVETIGAGCVVGAIIVGHGADTASSGLGTIYSGIFGDVEVHKTYTQRTVAAGATTIFHATPEHAQLAGDVGDFAVGVVPSLGVGILRRSAIAAAEESPNVVSLATTRNALTLEGAASGHTSVGVSEGGATTVWGELRLGTQANPGGATLGDAALVIPRRAPNPLSTAITNVAVTEAGAQRASVRLADWMARTAPGVDAAGNRTFSLLWGWTRPGYETCATVGADVMRSGGVAIPLWARKPSLVYAAVNYGYQFTAATAGATSLTTSLTAPPPPPPSPAPNSSH